MLIAFMVCLCHCLPRRLTCANDTLPVVHYITYTELVGGVQMQVTTVVRSCTNQGIRSPRWLGPYLQCSYPRSIEHTNYGSVFPRQVTVKDRP